MYLCDTDTCHSVWVASGLTRRYPHRVSDKYQYRIDTPDVTHTESQVPVSHRYSNFLLMMGTWMPETCR